jgi:hypothetical protein
MAAGCQLIASQSSIAAMQTVVMSIVVPETPQE